MIALTRAGSVAVLTFQRADQRNALTPEMLGQFCTLAEAIPPDARVLVVAGDGPTFCAGFDLTRCRDNPESTVLDDLLVELHRVIQILRSLPIPVVGAVQGAAIAGGCALLGGMDVIVSHPDAKLGYPVTPLGISPAVSAPTLIAAIGPGPARELLLRPTLLSGTSAASRGLVHELVETPEAVVPRAMELAADLAAKPVGGVSATRGWLGEFLNGVGTPVDSATRALMASRSLVGSAEQRALLPRAWARREDPNRTKDR